MMKNYVSPQLVVIEVASEDVLTTSPIETPNLPFPGKGLSN